MPSAALSRVAGEGLFFVGYAGLAQAGEKGRLRQIPGSGCPGLRASKIRDAGIPLIAAEPPRLGEFFDSAVLIAFQRIADASQACGPARRGFELRARSSQTIASSIRDCSR